MDCKKCGEQLEENAVECPKCGEKVPPKSHWLWTVTLIIAFVAVVLGLLFGIFVAVRSWAVKNNVIEAEPVSVVCELTE